MTSDTAGLRGLWSVVCVVGLFLSVFVRNSTCMSVCVCVVQGEPTSILFVSGGHCGEKISVHKRIICGGHNVNRERERGRDFNICGFDKFFMSRHLKATQRVPCL